MTVNGQRLLDELGVVRYRLRRTVEPVARIIAEAEPLPATPGSSSISAEPSASSSVAAPGVANAAASHARVHLVAPAQADWPVPAQAIWPQVQAWLGVEAGEIEWLAPGDDRGLALPDPDQWSTAAGRRALWLALKRTAVDLIAEETGGGARRNHGRGTD